MHKTGEDKGRRRPPFIVPHESSRWEPLAAHQPRYYRSESGTTVVRYYRPTVLLKPSSVPTTAESSGLTVVSAVLARGTTVARYYRPTVLPGASTVPTTAESSGLTVVSAVLAHGTTVARYYRSKSGTTALAEPGSPGHTTDELQMKQANPELP